MKNLLYLMLLPFFAVAHSPQECKQKINALVVLQDYKQADLECDRAIAMHAKDQDLYALKLKCLGFTASQKQVIDFFSELPFQANDQMLQALGWSILQTSLNALNSIPRRVGLIGAFLTQDVKSVLYIERALNDSNRSIRQMAARLASQMPDLRLQKVLIEKLSSEKDFFVRLDLIEALGRIRGVDGKLPLKKVLTSFSSTTEEKSAAILALLEHDLDGKFFNEHLSSSETYRQLFVIDAICHLQKTSYLKKLTDSLSHFNKDVRATSLMALYFLQNPLDENVVENMLNDHHPLVRIIAAFILLEKKQDRAKEVLKKWGKSDNSYFSMVANCLIANGGNSVVSLMYERFLQEQDPYCKINLALGLCRNRAYVQEASAFIIECIKNPNFKCMRGPVFRSFFPAILPIQKGHRFGQFGYEQVDSMTKLEMINQLMSLDVIDSEDLLKNFLKHAQFGIGIEALHMLFSIRPMEALDKIEEFLEDENLHVRMQAAIICCFFGKVEKAKEILIKDYQKVDREMKLNIIDALIHLRDEKLNPFFMNVIMQEDEVLQIAAAAGIICSLR